MASLSLVALQGCNLQSRFFREGIYLGIDDRPKSNELSLESREVLLRATLLDDFEDDPEVAFNQLLALMLAKREYQQNPKVLFASAELANVIAERKAPPWSRRPFIDRRGKLPGSEPRKISIDDLTPAKKEVLFYYGLASYLSFAYLNTASRDLMTVSFNPRFRFGADIYNYSLEQSIRFTLDEIPFHPKAFFRYDDTRGKVTEARFQIVGFDWKESDFHELLPASDFRPEDAIMLSNQHGLGVPMIGIRYRNLEDPSDPYPPVCAFPVTALQIPHEEFDLERTEDRETFLLVNPLVEKSVDVGDFQIPIESDLTTPLHYLLTRTGFDIDWWDGFRGKDENLIGDVFVFQPHRKGRIPVILCHGLLSSARPWESLVNGLLDDEWIRRRYEFWFMQYPTGRTVLDNTLDLRYALSKRIKQFDPEGADPALQHMVMIGHSMGGLIGRVLTQDPSDAYWNTFWSAPVEDLDLSEEDRKHLLDLLKFKPFPGIDRIVCIGAPHQGAPLASRPLAWIGRQLISAPMAMVGKYKAITDKNSEFSKVQIEADQLNSLQTLRPDSDFIQAVNAIPPNNEVVFHNIVGNIEESDEEGSDGIVPLSSARISFSASEVVVPAKHTELQGHPITIQEIERILRLHYDEHAALLGEPDAVPFLTIDTP